MSKIIMRYNSYTTRVLSKYSGGFKVYKNILRELSFNSKMALHLGCGRDLSGIRKLLYNTTKYIRVIGIDPDLSSLKDYGGEAWNTDGENIPFSNYTFDIVFSEYVLEHLIYPERVFNEINRVLRPGGYFISVTLNYYSYKSIFANITPHSFHKFAVNKLRSKTREKRDVYPTYFRANTFRRLNTLAYNSHFEIEQFEYIENGPTWFQRNPVLFEIGVLVHMILRLRIFSKYRCNIVLVLRKPGNSYLSDIFVKCIKCEDLPMNKYENGFICNNCGFRYLKEDMIFRPCI